MRWQSLLPFLMVATLTATAGCAGARVAPPGQGLPDHAELLSGRALFGEPVSADELPDKDLLGLDGEMREFVARSIEGARVPEMRLRSLLRSMGYSRLMSLDYDDEETLTARETFHARRGNCLAFTNLFVALAREAGLQVQYQVVDVPANWAGDGEVLLYLQHVNAVIHRRTSSRPDQATHVVDFNTPRFQGNYPQRPVDDAYVEALFYNNLAAQAMREGDQRSAFVYFLKASRAHGEVPAVWANLGVLYRRGEALAHAEAALHQSLRVDPGFRPAISNLVALYEQQGETELAETYRQRIRYHQQNNPYYQLYVAERALAEGRTDQALAAINRAIRLRQEEHLFHYMRAMILARTGDVAASRASLERAREYATVARTQAAYERKLREHY